MRGRFAFNEAGNRFGFLVAKELEPAGDSSKRRWICDCDCGVSTKVAGSNLRNGSIRSCGGCGLVFLPGDEAAFRQAMNSCRVSAVKRNLEFSLSKDEFRHLSKMDCFYCGLPPSNEHKPARPRPGAEKFIYTGLDRVDNAKGYLASNVVPCCKACNRAKSDMREEDFSDWIERIAMKHLEVIA